MLRTITNAKAIQEAQRLFTRRVEEASARNEVLQLGFQGGGLEAKTYVLPDQGIWIAISEIGRRYWNALSLGDPAKDDLSIVVEVNPPKSGLDRRVSGLFLTDASGNIHMAHRGGVGGGRKGIGKTAFQDWYPEPFTTVDDDGDAPSVILIGELEAEDFLERLASFTKRVADFKRDITAHGHKTMNQPIISSPESGRTIILISCSSRKSIKPAPATKLYQGTLFKASMAWAEQQRPDAIYILSARHHLVEPDQVLEQYDLTLNAMPTAELRQWSDTVLEQLRSIADIQRDRFIILAGDKYRRFLTPHLHNVELPLESMRIGEQVQFLQQQVAASESASDGSTMADCAEIHQYLAALPRFRYPFEAADSPKNGIYILFESGEHAHGTDRIVRVGTHRGDGQLPARLNEHFLNENKDRSIFRKNIGRALLHREQSPLATQWEIDLTSRDARDQHGDAVDHAALKEIEHRVSAWIRANLSFCVLEVPEKSARMRLEAGLIATVNRCPDCSPSSTWLGRVSPKPQISKSGLWLVQGLDADPLTQAEWNAIRQSRTAQVAGSEPIHANKRPAYEAKAPGRPKGSRNMSKKYAPLEEYLRSAGHQEISLTFEEIESILSQPLPRSARDIRSWWSNPRGTQGLSQQSAWIDAGYHVSSVSLGERGWVKLRRYTKAEQPSAPPVQHERKVQNAITHGGRERKFKWWIDDDTLRIRNTDGLEHSYSLTEIVTIVGKLHQEFGSGLFPLGNNVEKLYRETERPGFGTTIYAQPHSDTLHAQGASYLGVILEQAGILEWNNERRGIEWRIGLLPLTRDALLHQLYAAPR